MAIPFKYNRRSLLFRRVSNLMTGGGIALVVAVFVIVMALVGGLESAIRESGSPRNMIILARGADSEVDSSLELDQLNTLKFLKGIEQDKTGNPLVSPELDEQIFMDSASGSLDVLAVRGVELNALAVHDKVRIIAGRMFSPSSGEVLLGKSLVGRYLGSMVGSSMRFGRRAWKVVGVFDAVGTSFESEVWCDVHDLQQDTNREASFSGVRLRLAAGADVAALARRIADDPRINLEAQPELKYYQEQSAIGGQLRLLGLFVAGIMALGAVFAAMNTMYAAVSARTTEIGTLRALGFGRAAIMTSFLIESTLLGVVAGMVGVLLALPIRQFSATVNTGMTSATLAFDFRVTFAIAIQALLFAALMGLAAGWLPARQAMRMEIVDSLRKT
jgi:putative ABC transport system permease protein